MVSKSERFMEFLRANGTPGAANGFKNVEIKVPASKTESLAMLIHRIDFYLDPEEDLDAPAHADKLTWQLCSSEQSAIIPINNSAIVDMAQLYDLLVTSGLAALTFPIVHEFNPPILYAKDTLYLGIQTVGQGDADTMGVRVGYTLEKVTKDQFIEALVD